MSNENRKAVRGSENFWQLQGESDLHALTLPDPPQTGSPTTIRMTHSNTYGPFDEVDFYVRLGNPASPTAPDALDTAKDWIQARLVEELVFVDEEEILRSQAEESLEDETPWEGTYEAQLTVPPGNHSIEIKIISHEPELLQSMVLTGWEVSAK